MIISVTEMAKELSRGIFWVLADTTDEIDAEHIYAIQKYCNLDGTPTDFDGFSSADGQTYNHRLSWQQLPASITKNKPFDYYPRGRVEIRNGKATIWMNGNILDLAPEIARMFGLAGLKVTVKEDGSEHYKCHFDR